MEVRDLVNGSLELCGIIAAGETPSADDSALALRVLNNLLDSWSTENLALYFIDRKVFELVPGQSMYSIGKAPGADFDMLRPMTFKGAAVGALRRTPDLFVDQETPVEIVDYQKWIGVANKTLSSSLPAYLYPVGGTVNATIDIYPVPSGELGLVLYTENELTQFASLDDEIEFPPGYKMALEYCLAVEMAPRFGQALSPNVGMKAIQLKANIKRKNTKVGIMTNDTYGLSTNGCRTGNIFSGRYR